MEQKKSRLASSTLWMNGLVIVLVAGLSFAADVIPPGTAWSIIVLGALNFLNRFRTKKPVV